MGWNNRGTGCHPLEGVVRRSERYHLIIEAKPSRVPAVARLKRLLKFALRACGMTLTVAWAMCVGCGWKMMAKVNRLTV